MEWILHRFSILCLLLSISAIFSCYATTEQHDVLALQGLYNSFGRPKQLKGWIAAGPADPCEQSWTGIECSGSEVIHIKLHGLQLESYLGGELFNLHSLKTLDLSLNKIQGVIPDRLPHNLTHLNLSSNKFLLSIPHSFSYLRKLRHLNLSHNMLSGPIGSVFEGLENLKEMDLSYNKFNGDLPSSFASLTNLSSLYLQNNELTGSVIYLSNLTLHDLNIEDNHFSGIIPDHFQQIPNLWIAGNNFNLEDSYMPWGFPFDKVPKGSSNNSHPSTKSSFPNNPPTETQQSHKKKRSIVTPIVLAFCGTFILSLLIYIIVKIRKHAVPQEDLHSSRSPFPVSPSGGYQSPAKYGEGLQAMAISAPPMGLPRNLPAIGVSTNFRGPLSAKCFTIAELQLATGNFGEEKFLGSGSLGLVYKAEFPDGQDFVVKTLDMVPLSFQEEDQFLDIIRCTSRLNHTNIVRLVGYCVEQGQHLLVYEHVRDLTLEKALHSKLFMPLSWEVRVKIAFGVAQALDYMHSLSIAHCNLKAANIMLEEDLVPRVCDTALSILRPLTSNNTKVKASKMAINDCGYIAQDNGQIGIESMKADIYAFGVLLLELLTGRKPFDSSRPANEQLLVQWAGYNLHFCGSLEDIVDPSLRVSFLPPKALDQCADIISACCKPEKELRPQMSDVIELLKEMLPKPRPDGLDNDPFEKSFRSTRTRFSEMA